MQSYSQTLRILERTAHLEYRILDDLKSELTSPHIRLRVACAGILLKHNYSPKEASQVLKNALKDAYPGTRQLAATWLVYCGHLSESVILGLIEASSAHTSDMHWETGTGVDRKRARVALGDA